jgi:hypothetical protein
LHAGINSGVYIAAGRAGDTGKHHEQQDARHACQSADVESHASPIDEFKAATLVAVQPV